MIGRLPVELLTDDVVRETRADRQAGVVERTRTDRQAELRRRYAVHRNNLIYVDGTRSVQPAPPDVSDFGKQVIVQFVLDVEVVLNRVRRPVIDINRARASRRAAAEQSQEGLR